MSFDFFQETDFQNTRSLLNTMFQGANINSNNGSFPKDLPEQKIQRYGTNTVARTVDEPLNLMLMERSWVVRESLKYRWNVKSVFIKRVPKDVLK